MIGIFGDEAAAKNAAKKFENTVSAASLVREEVVKKHYA